MKALRIKLTQTQANYRKEETNTNKMTYPLPPFSTVIGAIHKACNFTQYHPMDISVQGNFGAMQVEAYRHHMFFNNFQNDRGIMVKLKNPNAHSAGFQKVAETIKPQGNDFFKEITIRVLNRELLDEWKSLKTSKQELDEAKKNDDRPKNLNDKIKILKAEQKTLDKKSERFLELKVEIETLTNEKKSIENDYKEQALALQNELDKYASLVTSIKYYEVLYDVSLIIHVKADEQTLKTIEENIGNLQSIGRYEDFVNVTECKMVELLEDDENEQSSEFSGYIKLENIRNENIFLNISDKGEKGTKYYLNKDYKIENSKRIFNKHWVIYADKFSIEDCRLGEETGIFLDEDNIIVNFI